MRGEEMVIASADAVVGAVDAVAAGVIASGSVLSGVVPVDVMAPGAVTAEFVAGDAADGAAESVLDQEAPVESRRRKLTRTRLMDAAYEVFAEYGIRASSVEMISERAGFTRGAFYSNFESKEELFFALADRENQLRFDRTQEGLVTALAAGAAGPGRHTPDAIEGVVEVFLGLQLDDRRWCLAQSEFKLLAMRDPAVAPRYLASQQDNLRQLEQLLDAAADAMGLRFTVDTATAAHVVFSLYESALQDSLLGEPDGDSRSVHALAMRTLPPIMHAISAPRE